jgi:hypothetical protein
MAMFVRAARAAALTVRDPAAARYKAGVRLRMLILRFLNRTGRAAIVGSAPVVVSMTTFGHRTATAFFAIESIGRGAQKPQRFILWIDDKATFANLPAELVRLRRRGLEIRQCPNYGPHKKQFPYARENVGAGLPLCTADDDILYPNFWLDRLLQAHRAEPSVIHCYRAHRIATDANGLRPYREWTAYEGTAPSYRAFATGVSGVVYPAEFVDALAGEGDAFMELSPAADDIWVNAVALRHHYQTSQVGTNQLHFPAVPGTQLGTLYRSNVVLGGNDAQLARTHGPIELAAIGLERDG